MKGHPTRISEHVIHSLCLLGLWLGLGLHAHAQSDTVTYIYTDPQGTPLVEADAQGNVIARYDYSPYGTPVAALGSPPDGPGYTGHVRDPESGLVYMQARYYQPIGQFLSPDPVGPSPGNVYSFNRYAYANNNPVVNIDPYGLSSITFNGENHTITFYSESGEVIGTFPAYNNVYSHDSIGKLVNGTYQFVRSDQNSPHLHSGSEAKENGAIGPGGIFRFRSFKGADGRMHVGVGIHAGRIAKSDGAHRKGPAHATNGCIRTNDAAIQKITAIAKTDPLTSAKVINNRRPKSLPQRD